ncbi:murein L,D-transpeptidase, partial [Methylopila musalis]
SAAADPALAVQPAVPSPATPAALAPTSADPVGAAVTLLLATDGAGAGLKLTAADRTALTAFYASRAGQPVWIDGDAFNARADAARARIAAADDDGLDASRFALPTAPATTEPAELARAELRLSAAALAYARQAWGGRTNPAAISRNIEIGTPVFDAAAALNAIAAADDVAATLDGFNPPQPQFQALRALLKQTRAEQAEAAHAPVIPEGKLIKPGDSDPRVPQLRARLGLDAIAGDTTYDDALATAVTAFQKTSKLGASGLVNRQTVRAMNTGRKLNRTAQLLVNMERWRWMPRELGAKHVFVDLTAFKLAIMQDGRETYGTRVVIGKTTNQTPMLSSEIDRLVVNPYWNVPVSIAMNEMAGSALRGYEVVDAKGRVVPPSQVDWAHIRESKLRIRQPPGERNALGNIKFMFPNKHAVYLHDTPSRKLFANDFRALSHGCVRVDKPMEFADALSGDQGLSGSKLKGMIGGKERGLPLSSKIPVHLAYFTAVANADGSLDLRPDLYGMDARVRAALAGEALPALPDEPVIAKAPPRPKPATQQASAATAQPAPAEVAPQRQPNTFGSWLSRTFGDSR